MQGYSDTLRSFYSHDAEREVIGGLLVSERALKHVPQLCAEDFTDNTMRTVFSAIQRLYAAKEQVDLMTVDATLGKMGCGEMTGTLVDCARFVVSSANIEAHIAIVKDFTARRRVREIAEQALCAIQDPTSDTDFVISQCRQALREIVRSHHSWVEMPELMLDAYAHFERIQRGEIKSITTGIHSLDNLISGFFGGEMTVIGARPSVGKTSFALNIALAAASAGKHVCFVSVEMSQQQFAQRIYSQGGRINGMKLRTGKLDDSDWLVLAETLGLFSQLPMSYLFSANTLEDISVEVQKKADAGQLDMLIVDYLQLIRTRERFRDERLRVSHISAELKQMSKDYHIPVIALSQLRRPTSGINYVPTMQDLKESGNIEQDADGIILMHRAESADDDGVDARDRPAFDQLTEGFRQYITFNVDKQRQGQIGMIATVFDPTIMRYLSIR